MPTSICTPFPCERDHEHTKSITDSQLTTTAIRAIVALGYEATMNTAVAGVGRAGAVVSLSAWIDRVPPVQSLDNLVLGEYDSLKLSRRNRRAGNLINSFVINTLRYHTRRNRPSTIRRSSPRDPRGVTHACANRSPVASPQLRKNPRLLHRHR